MNETTERVPSVYWATNLPAPYRTAVFEELGRGLPLHVAYLADAVDGRDWSHSKSVSHTSEILNTARVPGSAGERELRIWFGGGLKSLISSDVVVLGSWESPAYWQMMLLAKIFGKAVVVFYESTLVTNRYRGGHPISIARRLFLRCADSVLTAGVASTRAVVEMGIEQSKVVSGFNTVAVREFAEAAERKRSNSDAFERGGHTYLFVGRALERKNLRSLILAFASIAAPHDRLLVVGGGHVPRVADDPLGVDRQSCAPHVEFVGEVRSSRLSDIYAVAHTLVMPSLTEVWGMVVNEALACGLHVVTSEGAGVTDSVRSMAGVFPADPEPSSLADAMRRSRDSWSGPIQYPQMLKHGPEESAIDYRHACLLGLQIRTRRRRFWSLVRR